jgi:predicted aminopeptidase
MTIVALKHRDPPARARGLRWLPLAGLLLATVACSPAYLTQAAFGQLEVLQARRPLEEVLADPETPPDLRQRLLAADAALVFARTDLGLPRTGSYRHYADLGRPYVVWNVFAAPEFSLAPAAWCFPVAGCVPYRGYFAEAGARDEAARLAARGSDVFVGGVPAYATLGWFDDPLLNTLLSDDEYQVAATLFHELAHRQYYLPGDASFNEGFATFVEQEGLRRYLVARGEITGLCALAERTARRGAVLALLDGLRGQLDAIYAGGGEDEARRAAKRRAIDDARASYLQLRATWPGPPWFDGWFGLRVPAPGEAPVLVDATLPNNASLAALASYEERVPAFAAMLAEAGGELTVFYARVAELGATAEAPREAALDAYAAAAAGLSAGPPAGTCRNP